MMHSRYLAAALVVAGLVVMFLAIAAISIPSALYLLAGAMLVGIGALGIEVKP